MNKARELVLTTLLALTGSSIALAADIPAAVSQSHWAYKAVDKLVQAGIIDKEFSTAARGSKDLTRSEMATIVEKLIDNSGKANARQKALIDKLASEFALEINEIEVRPVKQETSSSFKTSGDVRIRWRTNAAQTATNLNYINPNKGELRTRINLTNEKVADHLAFYGRLQSTSLFHNQATDSHAVNSVTAAVNFDRVELAWKNSPDTLIQLGRFSPRLGTSQLLWSSDFCVDGAMFNVTQGRTVFNAGYADLTPVFNNLPVKTGSSVPSVNTFLGSIQHKFSKDDSVTLAFLNCTNPQNSAASLGVTQGYAFRQYNLSGQTKIGSYVLTADYITNRNPNLPANAQRNGFYATLEKRIDMKTPGSFTPLLRYMKLGNWAVDSTYAMNQLNGDGGDGIGQNGAQGIGIGFRTVLARNVLLNAEAYWLKPYDTKQVTKPGMTDYKPEFALGVVSLF